MNFDSAIALFVSAVVLLGSPGPAIACLLAVSRTTTKIRSIFYLISLLLGLATAAAISATGLFSIIQLVPGSLKVMNILATLYLLYIAYNVAFAPLSSHEDSKDNVSSSKIAGFLLGLSNPKAYVVFISLLSTYSLFENNQSLDTFIKWLIIVLVMVLVDSTWLWIGLKLKSIRLKPAIERTINVVLGLTIVLTIVIAYMNS